MKIEYKYGSTQPLARECVVAIGFFDGVHIAHRELIDTARAEAKRLSLPLCVFTFSDSTDIKKSGRLYTDTEKEELICSLSVDILVFADFASLKDITKDEFIDNVLIRDFGCQTAVVGYNFKFGKGALGNAEYLKRALYNKGKECIVKDEIALNGKPISSSYVKELLSKGMIDKANLLLGTPYHFTAIVKKGDGRGHTLGFPTANSDIGIKAEVIKRGVYRSASLIDGKLYSTLTNVGTCPTFSERSPHAESYLLDFEGELYDKEIKVYLLEYIREERRFSDAETLKMQINIDKNTVIKKNEEEKWQVLGQN